jgi:hypothetical protein
MKLKYLKLTALSAIAGMTFLGQSAKAASPSYTAGDLLLGFYATGGTGADQTYVFDLGNSATVYREATTNFTLATSLGTDLSSVFGSNWFSRSDLYWGVVGVRSSSSSGSVVNGDPVRTNYVSLAETTFGIQTTAPTISLSTSRANVATDIVAIQTGVGGFSTSTATANSNNLGAIIATSNSNSFDELSSKLSTDGGLDIFGNFGNGASGAALDLYRILNTNTGASPTGTVGVGSYEGTFTIDNSGNVSFAAVPEPSTWAMMGVGAAFLGMQVVRRSKKQAQVQA